MNDERCLKPCIGFPVPLGGSLLCLLFAAAGLTAWAGQPQTALQEVVRPLAEGRREGGLAVAVRFADKWTTYSYGQSGNPGRPQLDESTVFEIGSISKVFTTTLLSHMVRKGEATLEDPVSRYLPEGVKVPRQEDREITLLDLATHSSGFPRMPANFAPADPLNPYSDYTPEKLYAFLAAYKLPRGIGSQVEYSNLGVGLLGHLLARRAGVDFDGLVRTRICRPLGMNDTAVHLTPAMRRRMAQGHDANGKPAANWDFDAFAGAGGIRSTLRDMMIFMDANLGHGRAGVVSAMAATHKPRVAMGKDQVGLAWIVRSATAATHKPRVAMGKDQVGLAWIIRDAGGRGMIWHNGGTGGFASFAGFEPKSGAAVILLANFAKPDEVTEAGLKVLETLAGK
jgi:CubicO group peptidase (beta-lactamase class C family)